MTGTIHSNGMPFLNALKTLFSSFLSDFYSHIIVYNDTAVNGILMEMLFFVIIIMTLTLCIMYNLIYSYYVFRFSIK